MILRIKPYAVKVKYLPGRHLVLADALSRSDEFELHLLDELSETMFHKIKLTAETKRDPELRQLHEVVMNG